MSDLPDTTGPFDQRQFWDRWHTDHRDDPAIISMDRLLNAFLGHLQPGQTVLELGAGQGLDTLALAAAGLLVKAIDFSDVALTHLQERASEYPELAIEPYLHNLLDPLPFSDSAFDGVYASLSLHYFTDDATHRIFREIARVARDGAPFAVAVKSTTDARFGLGEFIEPNVYVYKNHLRHFFSEEYLRQVLTDWNVVSLWHDVDRYSDNTVAAYICAIALRASVAPPM